jgi:hypothetical protein
VTRKIGYIGHKRYVRLTITPGANTGNAFASAIAILGQSGQRPDGQSAGVSLGPCARRGGGGASRRPRQASPNLPTNERAALMRAKVLKAFAYAHDGITVEHLAEGDHVEIRDELVDGLTAEGHIGDPDVENERAVVEIPPDWQALTWPKLQAIGRQLGLGRTATKPDTLATVAAELARRGPA